MRRAKAAAASALIKSRNVQTPNRPSSIVHLPCACSPTSRRHRRRDVCALRPAPGCAVDAPLQHMQFRLQMERYAPTATGLVSTALNVRCRIRPRRRVAVELARTRRCVARDDLRPADSAAGLAASGLPGVAPWWMDRCAITATLLVVMCAIGFVPQRASALAAAPVSGAAVGCVGDCDGDDRVTIDEIVTGVNVALGSLSLDRCRSFDCDGNGEVTVDCLIRAVIGALNGCAPPVTASSTPAATATLTPTVTPS